MITPLQPRLSQAQLKTFNNKEQNHQEQSFKGAPEVISTAFNLLNTNPSLGAVAVDVCFMDTPRTLVDATRNPDAGLETAAREYSSTVNHGIAGFVGLGAGYLVSQGLNKANGVKAHMLQTNNEAFEVFGKFIQETGVAEGSAENFYKSILSSAKGYNSVKNLQEPWLNFSKEAIDEASKLLAEADSSKYKLPGKVFKEVNYKLISDMGASETFKLAKDGKEVQCTLKNLLQDAFSIRKIFLDKAKATGEHVLSDTKFIDALKRNKTTTAIAGLAVPVAIGMSLQPVNAYMTKKRTGKEGFVGGDGRQPDKSTGFKVLKTFMGAGIGAAMLRSIGPYKEVLSKIQYKGLVPTIPQFKLIYSATIFSRLLAARDKDELRESTIKDTLGFVNWLILGGFVSKLALNKLDKNLINYDEKTHGKGGWNWITKAVEKSHEEILYPVLKKAGISIFDKDGKALSYGKLMKALKEKAKSPEANGELKQLVEKTSKKINNKNIAQVLGYVYSGVVLGVGIPKLNIAIKKHLDKKRALKAQAEQKTAENKPVQMQIPETNINKTFSSFLGSVK